MDYPPFPRLAGHGLRLASWVCRVFALESVTSVSCSRDRPPCQSDIRYELFMNLLLKLYGPSCPIVEAIPKCSAGSDRVTENVHSFLYRDALRGGRDLLLAVSRCTLQRMEAASASHL